MKESIKTNITSVFKVSGMIYVPVIYHKFFILKHHDKLCFLMESIKIQKTPIVNVMIFSFIWNTQRMSKIETVDP